MGRKRKFNGGYKTYEEAEEVAIEIGNGIVVQLGVKEDTRRIEK